MGDGMHRRHLAEADRHIAASLDRIARQRDLIDWLKKGGHNSGEARRLLCLFEETLRLMQEHREMIQRALL